jgi:hypothetical protein
MEALWENAARQAIIAGENLSKSLIVSGGLKSKLKMACKAGRIRQIILVIKMPVACNLNS